MDKATLVKVLEFAHEAWQAEEAGRTEEARELGKQATALMPGWPHAFVTGRVNGTGRVVGDSFGAHSVTPVVRGWQLAYSHEGQRLFTTADAAADAFMAQIAG